MILIETIKCDNKLDAHRKERKIIEDLVATLNVSIPTRTQKEWLEDNKEHVKQVKHDNGIKYFQEHKENILKKTKLYQQEHRERSNELARVKYKCACGMEYCKSGKSRHEKRKFHQQYSNSLSELT